MKSSTNNWGYTHLPQVHETFVLYILDVSACIGKCLQIQIIFMYTPNFTFYWALSSFLSAYEHPQLWSRVCDCLKSSVFASVKPQIYSCTQQLPHQANRAIKRSCHREWASPSLQNKRSPFTGSRNCFSLWLALDFPGSTVVKNAPTNTRDTRGSTLGSGRSPGVGNGNPLQYSPLENSMDRRAWWATVHGVTKGRTWLSAHTRTHTHTCTHTHTHTHTWRVSGRTFMATNFQQCEWAKKQLWAWVSEISTLLMFTLLSSACLFIFKQKYFSFYAFGFINFQITKKVFWALCDFTCVWVCIFLHFSPQDLWGEDFPTFSLDHNLKSLIFVIYNWSFFSALNILVASIFSLNKSFHSTNTNTSSNASLQQYNTPCPLWV